MEGAQFSIANLLQTTNYMTVNSSYGRQAVHQHLGRQRDAVHSRVLSPRMPLTEVVTSKQAWLDKHTQAKELYDQNQPQIRLFLERYFYLNYPF